MYSLKSANMGVKIKQTPTNIQDVILVFEENVMRLICGYALQSYGCLGEKNRFLKHELKGEWDKQGVDGLVVYFSYFSGMGIDILMDLVVCMKGMV